MIRLWKHHHDCWASTALIALVAIFHGSALSGSWRWDDGMHLLHTTQYSWSSAFIDPEVMRSVSGNQFAPWNFFLYYVNGVFFGTDVQYYYAHHLLSLVASASGVYALLRQWLSAHHALVAPTLLLTGVPTFQMAQQLMVGHYLYGLFFVTLGLVFFVRSVHARSASAGTALVLSLVSALFYGLACLCKEIFVPWILMWLVITWALKLSPREMMLHVAPAMSVAFAYTVARLLIFGGTEGYYGGGTRSWDPIDIIQSLASIPGALLGDGIQGISALALVFLALCAASRKSMTWLLMSASCVLVTLVPLVFLAGSGPSWSLHARYLWAPWLLICLVWSLPWRESLSRMKWLACVCFLLLVAWQVTTVRPADLQREAMFDAHSQIMFQNAPKVTYWAPAEFNGSGYMTFVTYAMYEAISRKGYATGDPPKILRAVPDTRTQQSSVQIWHPPCNCFRAFLALEPGDRDAALTRMRSEKGKLLPGIHPLADAYQGPTPMMHIEGNRLHVTGTTDSHGPGHLLLLAGWAPSRLVSSRVTTSPDDSFIGATMRFELVLESTTPENVHRTLQHLCVLKQSQIHPYQFVALDSAAPTTACRKLLTPWAISQNKLPAHK